MKKLNALMKRKNLLHKRDKKEADYRAGIIASVMANTHRDIKKKPQPYDPKDFMPKEKKKKEQSWKIQLQIAEVFNKAFGGKDKRGGSK